MKLFIGLGNPGKEYENTRHNAGFMFVDFLRGMHNLTYSTNFKSQYTDYQNKNGEKVILLKPQTFMNNSGSAVHEIMKFYKISPEDIWITFDDLDIALGEFKVQKAKYPKVHNGVNSIINKTGTDQFNFIRIGINDRNSVERTFIQGRDYVLQKFDYPFIDIFNNINTLLKEVLY